MNAEASLYKTCGSYRTVVGLPQMPSGIYPAEGSCKCDWYDWFYDPSCAAREIACQDPPDPRDPSGEANLPTVSVPFEEPLTNDPTSVLSSQISALQSDLKRQLAIIAKCVCPQHT